MNKFYIQIVLFLLSISIYVNNKTFAAEPAPGISTAPESTLESESEATLESKSEATLESTSEATLESTSEATLESTSEATLESTSEATLESESEATLEPTYDATLESAFGLLPDHCSTPEEIYEKNKHLLCTDPEEAIKAGEVMNEAVELLKYHAITEDDYEVYERDDNRIMFLYNKKHHTDPDIKRIHCTIYTSYEYNEIINMPWDPDYASLFNAGSVKIVRVYNPNLVMVQHRYKDRSTDRQKYFYALAAKVKISENKTIIVMTSANINDHNPSNEKYINKIVKSANSFKTDIDSEDDIRKGELKKTFANIFGYLIEKDGDYVNIAYVESVDEHDSI
ncbi:hypothetical protein YYC_01117 [Plasmodium yoelii 17X]|uniref:Fam-a protein n=1 Tax=Plasmodium yoelii 17X TaxID=1323249 RepID=V7PU13_PLAYE|nr:hypothetical protein YYC_01117 [Plasmodium yoelii 17X]